MVINSLKIYGFGKISDMSIDLKPGVNIIEGNNEVGKTTLMAFIRAMLFGFESRRNMYKRYEPMLGGKFGGILYLADEKGEIYSIERVYHQKMAGDVKIITPNGETMGEEYLKHLIGKINENVFKQIFCFGLTELQQINSLSNDEINDFIYHVSTGSVAQILSMKQDLDNKSQQLFKSGGKNPKINILLNELDSLSTEIDKLKQKNMNYNGYSERIISLENDISNLEKVTMNLNEELKWYETLHQIYDINMKVREVEKALSEYPKDFKFPENGVERLNSQINNMAQIKIDYEQLLEKKKEFELLIENKNIDTFYIDNKEEIHYLNNKLNDYLNNVTKKEYLEKEYTALQTDIENNLKKVGTSFSEDDIRNFEYSIQDKEFIIDLSNKISSNEKELSEIDSSINQKNSMKIQVERKIDLLRVEEKSINSEDIKNIYPIINSHWNELKNKEWKKEQYREQKSDFTRQTRSTQKNNLSFLVYIILNLIVVTSGILLFFIDPIYAGIVLSLDIVFNLLFQLYNKSMHKRFKETSKSKVASLDFKISEIDSDISKIRDKALVLAETLGFNEINELTMQRLEDLRQEYLIFEQSLNDRQIRLNDFKNELRLLDSELVELINNKKVDYHKELTSLNKEWTDWLEKKGISTDVSISISLDLFLIFEQLKNEYSRKDTLVSDLEIINNNIDDFKKDVMLISDNDTNLPRTIEERVRQLVSNLRQVEKDHLEQEYIITNKNDVSDRIATICKQLEHEEGRYRELLEYANATNEEEFYRLEKEYDAYKELVDEKKQLLSAISAITVDEKDKEKIYLDLERLEKVDIDFNIKDLTNNIKEKTELIKNFSEEKGEMQNKVKELEVDLTLSVLNQKYADKSAELNKYVKEWMTLAFSKHVLTKTMDLYEKNKQPAVLQRASYYFAKMTGHNYGKIFSTMGTNELKAIRSDGISFEPQYLSRGTVEQLFLSMRFALVDEYSKQMLLPIILDDIFVNFDNNRLNNTLDAIQDLAKEHQILIFTCHNNLSNIISKNSSNISHLVLN